MKSINSKKADCYQPAFHSSPTIMVNSGTIDDSYPLILKRLHLFCPILRIDIGS